MSSLFSRRLFRTTAFRTALAYACVFSLLSALAMAFVYWSTRSHIESQVDARLRLETEVLLKLYRSKALPALLDTIRERSDKSTQQIFFYLLLGPNRGRLAGQTPDWLNTYGWQHADSLRLGPSVNGLPADNSPDGDGDGDGDDTGWRHYATLRLSDVFQVNAPQQDHWVRVLTTSLPGDYRLLVGRDLNEEKALLEHTLAMISTVIGVIFLLALAGSLIMGRSALRRIDAVSRTAGAIMAGDLSRRMPLSPRDNEFDQLSRKLNTMLERIEQLMAGMRQVTDNVAHDLRQPLNRLRNRLEVTLLEARSADEYRSVLEQSIHDADELLKTFNALLSIAQAEAGIKRNDWFEVDLRSLAEDVVELYDVVAEDAGIELSWNAPDNVIINGNRQLLAQALGNLLDNAVKYTPAGGRIELTVLPGDKRHGPAISVADSGPGIKPEDRERVLRRFVRLDSARSQPGNGLGLSLVNAVAKLHGARLTLDDNQPGLRVGLRFDNPV